MSERLTEQPHRISEADVQAQLSERSDVRVGDIVEFSHTAALEGENFEDAAAALDQVVALENFRNNLRGRPFGTFNHIFEVITTIQQSPLSKGQKAERVQAAVDLFQEKASRFSPRVADLYQAVLAEIGGRSYEPKFEMTRTKMTEMDETGDLKVLTSPETSWEMKLNRIETRLTSYLTGARAFDKREGKMMDDDVRLERQKKLEKMNSKPSTPPSRRNESKPGMDEMERLKEGERAQAIWTIHPAYGGYYKEQSFSQWDSSRNVWVEPNYTYSDVPFVPLLPPDQEDKKSGKMNFSIRAQVTAGGWTSLPIPYTHGIHEVKTNGASYSVQQDQNGDVVLMVQGDGVLDVEVVLSPQEGKQYGPHETKKVKTPEMPAQFSAETITAIVAIKQKKKGNLAIARALAAYTKQRLTYSNESKYNEIYDNDPKGYFASIDEHRKADCDVANTYFSALCAQLNIPTRQSVGHMVKGKDQSGSAQMTSGTGHGWTEVWDELHKTWERVDATPPGDPNMEENDDDNKSSNGTPPGDYGSEEAVRPTDEQMEKLRLKLADRKEKLSYSKEERYLAQAGGVELKEARKIVKEINEAEQTRLPNGELLVDVLARLFNAIVESRKVQGEEDDGPVSKEDGGEAIMSLVRHVIATKAGKSDPETRERPTPEEEEGQVIGGFDVYLIGDKSGSMSSTVEGENLWKLQRRAEYLIFSALYRFERGLQRAGIPQKDGLSARSQGISFRGNGENELDVDKPLSADFSALDKVKMWKSLTNQGSGNGDVSALTYVLNQVETEIAQNTKKGGKDNRLRLIIACSDGGPDSPSGVQQAAEALGKLKAVVVGVGLTKTARAVPEIFDTPYSKGDIVYDINDLPALVAKYVVNEAIKLFPERAREGAKAIITKTLSKFNFVPFSKDPGDEEAEDETEEELE